MSETSVFCEIIDVKTDRGFEIRATADIGACIPICFWGGKKVKGVKKIKEWKRLLRLDDEKDCFIEGHSRDQVQGLGFAQLIPDGSSFTMAKGEVKDDEEAVLKWRRLMIEYNRESISKANVFICGRKCYTSRAVKKGEELFSHYGAVYWASGFDFSRNDMNQICKTIITNMNIAFHNYKYYMSKEFKIIDEVYKSKVPEQMMLQTCVLLRGFWVSFKDKPLTKKQRKRLFGKNFNNKKQ